jgi:L-2-hydroxyglutarate oxidase LhgO
MEERMDALREFVPDAKTEDWVLADAGQRVQVIKRDADEGRGFRVWNRDCGFKRWKHCCLAWRITWSFYISKHNVGCAF